MVITVAAVVSNVLLFSPDMKELFLRCFFRVKSSICGNLLDVLGCFLPYCRVEYKVKDEAKNK